MSFVLLWQSPADVSAGAVAIRRPQRGTCNMLRIVAALAALAAATASPMWEKVSRTPKFETIDFTVATPISNAEGLQA